MVTKLHVKFVVPASPSLSVTSSIDNDAASSLVIFPLTFIANTFVPTDDFPAPLRVFAEWNPVSAVAHAARQQFGNIPAGAPEPTAWPLEHAVLYSLLWVAIILGVFGPLAVRRYQQAAE